MDGPRNYHAKWSQPYDETPTSNAFTDMLNLKKRQTEILQNRCWLTEIEKLMVSRRDSLGGGGCAWAVGWKSCEIRLLWSLYNYRCDKFIWVIKKRFTYVQMIPDQIYLEIIRKLALKINGHRLVAWGIYRNITLALNISFSGRCCDLWEILSYPHSSGYRTRNGELWQLPWQPTA